MLVHATKDFCERVVCRHVSDRIKETVSSIERTAGYIELRHVLSLEINSRRCGLALLSCAGEHVFGMISGHDVVTPLFELQRVSTRPAGKLEQVVYWPTCVLAQTLIHKRCFRLVRLLSVEKIVKFRVSA